MMYNLGRRSRRTVDLLGVDSPEQYSEEFIPVEWQSKCTLSIIRDRPPVH